MSTTSILQGLLDATLIAKNLIGRIFALKLTLNKRYADSLIIRKWRELGEKQCHEMCKRVLSDLLNFVIIVLTCNSSIVQSSTNLFLFINRTDYNKKKICNYKIVWVIHRKPNSHHPYTKLGKQWSFHNSNTKILCFPVIHNIFFLHHLYY